MAKFTWTTSTCAHRAGSDAKCTISMLGGQVIRTMQQGWPRIDLKSSAAPISSLRR